jgi:hypothetical protein
MVLHRCRLGGPSELETMVFSSVTQACPTHTLARCLPGAPPEAPPCWGPPTPGCSGGGAASVSAPLPRAVFSGGGGGSGGAGSLLSRRTSTADSATSSSLRLASLASEQALLDCPGLWVGADRGEHAVRGGARKGGGGGLARPQSYPAALNSTALAAAADGVARAWPAAGHPGLRHAASVPSAPGAGSSGGLAALARSGAPPAASPVPLPPRGGGAPAAAAPAAPGDEPASLGTLNLEALLLGPHTPALPIYGGGLDMLHRDSFDSAASGAPSSLATGDGGLAAAPELGVVHGGESQAQSRERCVRNGRRRNSGLMVRGTDAGIAPLVAAACGRSSTPTLPSNPTPSALPLTPTPCHLPRSVPTAALELA